MSDLGAVLAQLADQPLHVARGAAEILRAGAARVVVLIETRHGDDADLHVAAVAGHGAHRLVRGLRLERDAVARELDHLLRRSRRRAGRQQLQAHDGAARAADLLHHIVEAPADHVDELAGLAFADRGDAVVGGELAADGRGAAGDDVDDRDVIVGELQRCADALVGEAHLDVVFLGVARREVIRMRIERQHERVHERLEHILGLALVHALGHVLVALAQNVGDLGPLLARGDERQRVVLDALAPQLVHLGGVRRPRLLLPIEVEGFVDVEIRLLREQLDRVVHALAAALLEAAEDHEGRLDVARLDGIVELVAVLLELRDVARIEIAAAAVDGIEIAIEDQARETVIERCAPVVLAGDDVAHAARDVVFLLRGLENRAGRRGGRAHRRRHGGAEQCRKSDRARANDDGGQPARPADLGLRMLYDRHQLPFSCKMSPDATQG